MESEHQERNHEKIIHVNKTEIRVKEDELTGRQILERANLSPNDYDLFLVEHGHDGPQIQPDQVVKIKNGERFHAIRKVVPYG
jgi:hypothetical protein